MQIKTRRFARGVRFEISTVGRIRRQREDEAWKIEDQEWLNRLDEEQPEFAEMDACYSHQGEGYSFPL